MSVPRSHSLKEIVKDVKQRMSGSQTTTKDGMEVEEMEIEKEGQRGNIDKGEVYGAQESNRGEVSEI